MNYDTKYEPVYLCLSLFLNYLFQSMSLLFITFFKISIDWVQWVKLETKWEEVLHAKVTTLPSLSFSIRCYMIFATHSPMTLFLVLWFRINFDEMCVWANVVMVFFLCWLGFQGWGAPDSWSEKVDSLKKKKKNIPAHPPRWSL